MNFRKWLDSNTHRIGKVAVFYVPEKKIVPSIKKSMHEFLIKNYDAYTHERGGMKGYWRDGPKTTKDHHERYEVSFDGDENFKKLIVFLSGVCEKTGEDAIYLTFSGESYLVRPGLT